jgi:hypothetical protein
MGDRLAASSLSPAPAVASPARPGSPRGAANWQASYRCQSIQSLAQEASLLGRDLATEEGRLGDLSARLSSVVRDRVPGGATVPCGARSRRHRPAPALLAAEPRWVGDGPCGAGHAASRVGTPTRAAPAPGRAGPQRPEGRPGAGEASARRELNSASGVSSAPALAGVKWCGGVHRPGTARARPLATEADAQAGE